MTLDRELEIARDAALQAAEVLRRHREGPLEIGRKDRDELVTDADRKADGVIRTRLAGAFPDDAVCTEEAGDSPQRLRRRRAWIVDPLDSTRNYIELGDEFAVSIGLAVGGRAVLGVVCNPARDELFAGYVGRGVTLNGTEVRATAVQALEEAQLAVSRRDLRHGLVSVAPSLSLRPVASRAYKFARVAAGMDDGAFSVRPGGTWSVCAGAALVMAAGGRATLVDGSEVRFDEPDLTQPQPLVAAGPRLHPVLLAAVRGYVDLLADEAA